MRYEDLESFKNPFSFGFTLSGLSINTTNQNWEATFYDRLINENKERPIFKRLKIEGFALYIQEDDSNILSGKYEATGD